MSSFPERMTDHWWWRPGVRAGRALDPMREALRDAVASTVRVHRLAEPEWTPHVTLAYSNQEGPAAPAIEAMRDAPSAIDTTIRQVSLVSQERVGRLYRWDRLAAIRLGTR